MLNNQYKRFFDTLANKTRLEIIATLHEGPLIVSEIVRRLPYTQSTISHNLKRLQTCHFVTARKHGQRCFYTLNKHTIKPLMKIIEKHANTYCKQVCCRGRNDGH